MRSQIGARARQHGTQDLPRQDIIMSKLYRITSAAALTSIAFAVTGLAVLIGTGGFGA